MPRLFWRVCWIACLAALVLTGIDWGLPSAASDAYLFAGRAPWDGKTLAAYDVERVAGGVGSDVDRQPVTRTADGVTLNGTDAQRAEIVRRYRLYSHQPDEMITFMALQQMNPAAGEFDPRLYQYGGAWIYPVGGLLKAAAAVGLIDLRPDKAFYYDRPAAFGRFYVVARAYTLLAYVGLMACCGAIAWRLTDDEAAAASAAAVVGALPVVFALAHEAKPHVMGTTLVLACALAAARWVRTGRWADALVCGVTAGLAAGSVLSAAVVVLVPVTMVLLPHPRFTVFTDGPVRRIGTLAVVGFTAAVVYAATNPYVVLHAVRGDPVLASNLANSKAMYGVGSAGALLVGGATRLLDAMSWPALALAAAGLVLAVTRRGHPHALAVLLAVPTAAVLVQFFAFAAHKPAEYARFALLPAAVLGVLGVWALSNVRTAWVRRSAFVLTPLAVLLAGTWPYAVAFAADAGEDHTRRRVADAIAALPPGDVEIAAEPAPYAVPPLALWGGALRLSVDGGRPTAAVFVAAVDDPDAGVPAPPGYRRRVIAGDWRSSPITWANKPFVLLERTSPTTMP